MFRSFSPGNDHLRAEARRARERRNKEDRNGSHARAIREERQKAGFPYNQEGDHD